MNTAIQVKTHTTGSAKLKQQHNERKDNSIAKPDFWVIYKDKNHKFKNEDKIEKINPEIQNLKQKLKILQAKLSTYQKRLTEYQNREKQNPKTIEKLQKNIQNLQNEKAKIPKFDESRGKKREKKYIEFELSLTNSNHLKKDTRVQFALHNAVSELHKDPIFRDLKPISKIMHKDQFSLHIHYLTKINNQKTWDSILKEQMQENDKDNRDVYSRLQNKFNELMRAKMKDLSFEIDTQKKGVRYASLSKYKELTSFNQQEIKTKFLQKLENIDQKHNKNIVKKEEKEEKFDFENFVENIKDTQKISKKDEVSKILKNEDKKEENKIEKNTEKEKVNSKDLSNFKEVQKKNKEEKENQNENQNEKINEKNKSRGRGRDR